MCYSKFLGSQNFFDHCLEILGSHLWLLASFELYTLCIQEQGCNHHTTIQIRWPMQLLFSYWCIQILIFFKFSRFWQPIWTSRITFFNKFWVEESWKCIYVFSKSYSYQDIKLVIPCEMWSQRIFSHDIDSIISRWMLKDVCR